MLQDIAPDYLDNHYYPDAAPDGESRIIVMRGEIREREVLVGAGSKKQEVCLPGVSDFKTLEPSGLIYLFKISSVQYFLLLDDGEDLCDTGIPEGFAFNRISELRRESIAPQSTIFAIYTAFHLYEWYSTTRFCGKCGSKNVNDTVERARVCTRCGHKTYPRINPAVIIGVTDKETNKIILTKYRSGFSQNALVAGFTEIGETLEETVSREVMEEVGLKVNNIRYYKSQPWGVASDILSGFYCDVAGSKEIKMDSSELKYAEWVSPEDIVLQSTDFALTNEMMRLFKEQGYAGTIRKN
jgi:NAD+ diphosphatase